MNQVTLEEFNNLLNLKDDNNEDEDVCLISHETLTENNIKLYCGHCFNYEPLLNEIKYQKLNNNPLEIRKLKINEIKCPYCRKIQNKLLPCYGAKFYGVNHPDKYCMKPFKCSYVFKSGKNKGHVCNKDSIYTFCNKHKNIKQDLNTCTQILKSGKNAGKECSCKIFQDNLCKRHYKIKNSI